MEAMNEGAQEIPIPWYRHWLLGKNRYNRMELAGSFGDLGTLIPFVAGYIAVVGIDPLGILFIFGISQLFAGFYFRTPMPVQSMKVIGGVAIASGGTISAGMIYGAGLFTGIFWFLVGFSKTITIFTGLASKAIIRGIGLGLGLMFMADGVEKMLVTPWLGGSVLVLTFLLLARRRFPAMFAILFVGIIAACFFDPVQAKRLLTIPPSFHLPEFSIARFHWDDLVKGSLLLAIPQIPLTLSNAVVAIRAENNELFPKRPVSDRMLAVSQGILNLFAWPFGGVPLCHGAGGMAGHVRFGAQTGGALVMLGGIMVALALFFSQSVGLLFQIFPKAVLGVILFFAGSELAIYSKDIGSRKEDFYVMLVVAGFAWWNMGAAFLIGIILEQALKRGWVKL